MKFGTAIGVAVLATGVLGGVAALAVDPPPPEGQSKLDGTTTPPTVPQKSIEPVGFNRWKPAALAPEHEFLKGLVGKWTTTVHLYEGSVNKSRNTQGTAEGKALMGGLFVQLTQTETRMKQAYEGVKIFGYNEALNKYTADAIDNVGTASIHLVGTYDPAAKKLTMTTHYTDDKKKSLRVAKAVLTMLDDKSWTYEEFIGRSVGVPETPIAAVLFKKS
jgi:hypothetical protein